MSLLVALFQVAACLGFGAALLRLLRIDGDLGAGEHWAVSFAAGFGILGWLVFPLGIVGQLTPLALILLLTGGCVGALLLPSPPLAGAGDLDGTGRVLLGVLCTVFVFDILEGISPPADADTLAYHFKWPQSFVEAGRIFFVPRPLEGAGPLLVQMTYVPALALGGERALTLWTMLSGWASGLLLLVLCRRHLGVNWSLAATLVFLTTPAVLYGAGSGQVEMRLALFVMVAAWAAARAYETGHARYWALAGIGAGFYAAAKYTGLLLAVACGTTLLFQRRWLLGSAVFSAAFFPAGFQWYAWNAWHTGDPVFPMLFQWLGKDGLAMWTKAYDILFKQQYFAVENPLPRTLSSFFTYPFDATLGISGPLDSGRVGLGPFGLLTLPFAALGLWRFRGRLRSGPLPVYAAVAFLFYVLWFWLGGSQRVRHLLPVYPLFVVCMTVAAQRFAAASGVIRPLSAALALTISLQVIGHGVFAVNYLKFLNDGADRDAFLLRNVDGYLAVPWINANLTAKNRIFVPYRPIPYFLKVANFLGTGTQAAITLDPGRTDAATLYRQLAAAGITHLMLPRVDDGGKTGYSAPLDFLNRAGCLEPVKHFEGPIFSSRTLPTLAPGWRVLDILRLRDASCLK